VPGGFIVVQRNAFGASGGATIRRGSSWCPWSSESRWFSSWYRGWWHILRVQTITASTSASILVRPPRRIRIWSKRSICLCEDSGRS